MNFSEKELSKAAAGYFDYNATTPLCPEALDSMLPFLTTEWGNPSGACSISRKSAAAIGKAREQLSTLVKCDPENLVFTGTGSEASHLAWSSALRTRKDRKKILISAVEHSANWKHARALEQEGFCHETVPVNPDGRLDLQWLGEQINDSVALVSVMTANNETGVIHPIQEIGEMCWEKGCLFHTDAVQGLGKLDLDFNQLPVDFASFSAHKIYGPKGIGALYARNAKQVSPMIYGGGQERGMRSGTENVAGIVGFGSAAETCQVLEKLNQEKSRLKGVQHHLETEISRRFSSFSIFGQKLDRLVNTTFVAFEGIESEALLLKLNQKGFCLSPGSACSTGTPEPSRTLTAMGVERSFARGAVRISTGRYTTDEDIPELLKAMESAVDWLRGNSI